MTHPRADPSLTDLEEQDTRDHLRHLDAATLSGDVNTAAPAGSPAARGVGADATPGDRSRPLAVTGGLAQQALDNLRSALSSARAARALMEDDERLLPLPSRALANVVFAVTALESVVRDIEKGRWP